MITANYLHIAIEFDAIRNFLAKTLEAVDAEKAAVFARDESGEFTALDDFENAIFFPMQQEEIAIRAVFHEVNALVEWELYSLASKAYNNAARNGKTRKSLVYDLRFNEICSLIKEYYEIELGQMPSFTETKQVRETVNAFKHLKGFKDPRRHPDSKLLDKFLPTREDAYKAIDGARNFLRALIKECNQHENNQVA